MSKKKTFRVTFTTTGQGSLELDAENAAEARKLFLTYDENACMRAEQHEWEFDDVTSVEEVS